MKKYESDSVETVAFVTSFETENIKTQIPIRHM
jgi:hypothetical protein